jgi:replicative DNA helicase
MPTTTSHPANGLTPHLTPSPSHNEVAQQDLGGARAVWLAIRGKPVGTVDGLPDRWRSLLDFVASLIDDPESGKLATIKKYVSNLTIMDDRSVIGAAMHATEHEPIQDEPNHGPRPFSLDLIDSKTFFSETYHDAWLINGVIIEGEPGVIGGPSKSLKTSILVDAVISLGTRTPFLSKFVVPEAVRCALLSGESGKRTIQSIARQVCLNRGIEGVPPNVFWGFKVPQLTDDEHLAVLRKTIEDNGLKFVAVDPFYLTVLAGKAGIDTKDMFQMGPMLSEVSQACIEAGCTPLLAHHFVKKRDDPFGPPELGDLAFSGIGQFVRQWMLVAPRERFDAEVGLFRLHFGYGGSAGHCGEYALDIEVGTLSADSDRRTWKVAIATPAQHRTAKQEQRQAEQEKKTIEREQANTAAKDARERQAMGEALAVFANEPGHRLSANRLCTATGWGAPKARRILFLLSEEKHVRDVEYQITTGNGATKTVFGYELISDGGALQ